MKATLILIALCAALLTANCLPAAEETMDMKEKSPLGLHPLAYKYLACRMECRQNCMNQGYWYGVCKGDDCFCYGLTETAYPRMKEFVMPMY